MTTPASETAEPSRAPRLSLWDCISLMVGIVVGTSLFATPRLIFSNVPDGISGLALWTLGGLVSICGALLFAELAVSFPRGGAYTYLSTALGRTAGLAYGVSFLAVMLTANLGAMAFAFARYAQPLVTSSGLTADQALNLGPWLAAGAIFILAVFNSLGLQTGRRTQNVLTSAKLLGLALIVVAGLGWPSPPPAVSTPAAASTISADWMLAMVFVLYAFGGWSDAATVAAEVRDRSRNIPKALIGGLAGVTLIYLAVNVAYLRGLGIDTLRGSALPANDVVANAWGAHAGQWVSLLVMVSALGAVQGMLFSGSRGVAAMGADHSLFRPLGRWVRDGQVPLAAIWALAGISILQIFLIGTEQGKEALNSTLSALHIPVIDWNKLGDGFEVLVIGSAPTFWLLMGGVGIAFLILRMRKATPTEFRAPGGILIPVIYLGTCGFMFWRAAQYAGPLGMLGLVSCAVGVALSCLSRPNPTGSQSST